jgi:hypothetical protein
MHYLDEKVLAYHDRYYSVELKTTHSHVDICVVVWGIVEGSSLE